MYTDLYVVYRASETECNCYWRLTKDSPTNKRKQHKQKRNTPQPPRRTNKQTYVCSPLCLKSSPRNKRVNKTRENKIYFATIHKQSPGERELSLISDILKLLPKLVINDGLGKQWEWTHAEMSTWNSLLTYMSVRITGYQWWIVTSENAGEQKN